MLSKENTSVIIGSITVVLIVSILNLLLQINITISLIAGLLIGMLTGIIINKNITGYTLLGIIAWGLIEFAILSSVLKSLNIINSPPITELLLAGILAELLRIETKFKEFNIKQNMLWSDFTKRKEIR